MAGLFLATLLLCTGCASCPPCVRPVLATVPHPMLYEVRTNDQGGLDDDNTLRMLDDLDLLTGALDKCNAVIEKYNAILNQK